MRWLGAGPRWGTKHRPSLLLETLEDRTLMSAAPPLVPPAEGVREILGGHPRIFAPLSSGESGDSGNRPTENMSPTFHGFPVVILGEDGNDHYVDLREAFKDADQPASQLTFQVMSNSRADLFDSATIVNGQ
ncbi:MAG TPA: hypothetical protein VIY86_03320, partial [Pirellulaceae bacterium]